MSDERAKDALELMMRFAERTGLASERPPQRYLWTDAFAVCNLIGLARSTGEERCAELALLLVDRVHHALGRHRADDSRAGWLSGLTGPEAESHPTLGGLRIGKPLPERRPGEPFDEQLEWERDGQYFHYLTKWMHALDQVSRSTRQPHWNSWARELARTAYRTFTYVPRGGGRRRMVWKMSIDLTHPAVTSMGHHDPLDGFITCAQLQATASRFPLAPPGPGLAEETIGYESMTEGGDWVTTDPLGLGGLLTDAYRLAQLMQGGALARGDLLHTLLAAAADGLRHYARQDDLKRPAGQRLGFRELGLCIGLGATALMDKEARAERAPWSDRPLRARLEALRPYASLGAALESFWLEPGHREAATWSEHRDINEVMLATSLAPEGFLVLRTMD
jgi:hypothetical protein